MSPHSPAAIAERSRLRLRSLSWALLAALGAALLALVLVPLLVPPQEQALPWEPALRAAGCGFFYGLLAFHLQRVDPDDGHLQAGLVGAVCGIRSLGAPLPLPAGLLSGLLSGLLQGPPFDTGGLSSLMMEALGAWLPLWLPLIGSAVLLQIAQRLVPTLRP